MGMKGPAVLLLVLAAFLAGIQLQKIRQRFQQPECDDHKQRVSVGPLQVDPLDPAELERVMLEATGLVQARPPLQPGATGDKFLRAIPFQVLSWAPRIVLYPSFIDADRCDRIVEMAKRGLEKSGLAYGKNSKPDAEQQIRTSSGTFLSADQDADGVLAWLEERIAAATLLPSSHGEAFNVLRYEHNQQYMSHMDTFDPKDFGENAPKRIATVIIYLSDVVEGGETVFKKEGLQNKDKAIYDFSCKDGTGYRYKPRKGDAVLFWATTPKGDIDPQALHGSCPVVEGEKWVATKWIHDTPQSPDRMKGVE